MRIHFESVRVNDESIAQLTRVGLCTLGVVFISERSEFELIGDKYAETVLQNGGGLERMSDHERQRCQSREGQCRSWEVPGNAMSGI